VCVRVEVVSVSQGQACLLWVCGQAGCWATLQDAGGGGARQDGGLMYQGRGGVKEGH
jgi:hypothetical protein